MKIIYLTHTHTPQRITSQRPPSVFPWRKAVEKPWIGRRASPREPTETASVRFWRWRETAEAVMNRWRGFSRAKRCQGGGSSWRWGRCLWALCWAFYSHSSWWSWIWRVVWFRRSMSLLDFSDSSSWGHGRNFWRSLDISSSLSPGRRILPFRRVSSPAPASPSAVPFIINFVSVCVCLCVFYFFWLLRWEKSPKKSQKKIWIVRFGGINFLLHFDLRIPFHQKRYTNKCMYFGIV